MGIRYMNVTVPPEGHLFIIRAGETIRHYINVNPYPVQYPIDYDPDRDVIVVSSKKHAKVLHSPPWMTQKQELEAVVRNVIEWQ